MPRDITPISRKKNDDHVFRPEIEQLSKGLKKAEQNIFQIRQNYNLHDQPEREVVIRERCWLAQLIEEIYLRISKWITNLFN